MTMNLSIAQLRIAREIGAAEHALNEALLRQSSLMTSLVSARCEVAVGAFTGQDVLLRLAKAQQALLTSGNDLARVHGRLLDINREVGGGGASDCPDNWQTARVVDGEAEAA